MQCKYVSVILCTFKIFGLLFCQKSFRIVTIRVLLLTVVTYWLHVIVANCIFFIQNAPKSSLTPHYHRHFSNCDVIVDISIYKAKKPSVRLSVRSSVRHTVGSLGTADIDISTA